MQDSDLIIILDGVDRSNGRSGFRNLFLKTLIEISEFLENSVKIGFQKTHFSLIWIGDQKAWLPFPHMIPSQFQVKSVMQQLKTFDLEEASKHRKEKFPMNDAFEEAFQKFLVNNILFNRSHAPNIAIVLTNGIFTRAESETLDRSASLFKFRSVAHVFAVGIGNSATANLEKISGSKMRTVQSISQLLNVLSQFESKKSNV